MFLALRTIATMAEDGERGMNLQWQAFSLLVCLYVCLNIWQMESIRHPFDVVQLARADEVASLLRESLQPGDHVLTNHQESLAFYFFMYDLPQPRWNEQSMADSRRVILVADGEEFSSMMRSILAQHGLSLPDDDPAAWESLGEVGDVRLYVTKL